jgi:hypothetical protein
LVVAVRLCTSPYSAAVKEESDRGNSLQGHVVRGSAVFFWEEEDDDMME